MKRDLIVAGLAVLTVGVLFAVWDTHRAVNDASSDTQRAREQAEEALRKLERLQSP